MVGELGHFALILALLVSLLQGVLPLWGAHAGRKDWIALARPSATLAFLLVLVSFVALSWTFYVNDFSLAYVAQQSNTQLPLMYRLSAVWGGHEGSLLLWLLMLTGWAQAVVLFSRTLPTIMVARVLGVLGLVATGLMAFVLLTSSPFDRLMPAAVEGRSLNPLLQDPGLVFHPPLLYMGYVGFSVAFAFAIAALLSGQLDATWARWSRTWTTAAWGFLTMGIALGSWWAYYELGWGGWWFWDPVENASFMPWLVGTALIHSLAVTEKRGSFKNWTVLLAIATFSLSLLGTFLVRSGVLSSVHAFATDPTRGLFVLVFLVVVVGASLTLYAWRAPQVRSTGTFAAFSKEGLLLSNNVLLVVAAACVLLGTLYPLIIDALGKGKLSVGPPYFQTVFVPLTLPLVALAAFANIVNWKRAEVAPVLRALWPAALLAVLGAILLPWLAGRWMGYPALSLGLAVWLVAALGLQGFKRLSHSSAPASWWGMQLAHLGLAVFVIGVAMVGNYEIERDVRMSPGDAVDIGGYRVTFKGVREVQGPNYTAVEGLFELYQDGKLLRTLEPQKRDYGSGSMPMTEAAIDVGLTRDVYVSMGEALADERGAWAVRVYTKPFVDWIWGGCLFMTLGGFWAIGDRRYRFSRKQRVAASPVEGASA